MFIFSCGYVLPRDSFWVICCVLCVESGQCDLERGLSSFIPIDSVKIRSLRQVLSENDTCPKIEMKKCIFTQISSGASAHRG